MFVMVLVSTQLGLDNRPKSHATSGCTQVVFSLLQLSHHHGVIPQIQGGLERLGLVYM